MNKKQLPRTPDPEAFDDDAPQATSEWFARARPAVDVLPELFGQAGAAAVRHHLTRKAMADVTAQRGVSHQEVKTWAASLSDAEPPRLSEDD